MDLALDYLIHHVFLPQQLPQASDTNPSNDAALITELLVALKLFQAHLPKQERLGWKNCISIIRKSRAMRDVSGRLVHEKLDRILETMTDGDVVAIYVRAQNAGVVVRRRSDHFSFESSELSPTTDAVIGTKGRLRRCFPGPAIEVSKERIMDNAFRLPFIDLLIKLDAETLDEVSPVTTKAGSHVTETRDTVHPKFITEMMTGILRAIGRPSVVPRIYKNTRDDVLSDNARQPWRRSSLWLFLRVALQTTLMAHAKPDDPDPHFRYKSFMIFYMSHILKAGLGGSIQSHVLFTLNAKITRRLLKLGVVDELPWLRITRAIMSEAHREVARRWEAIEKNPDPLGMQRHRDRWNLSFEPDTFLSGSKLKPYLTKAASRPSLPATKHGSAPHCCCRIRQSPLNLPDVSHLKAADHQETPLVLADIELWVQSCLEDWLATNLPLEETCSALASLIHSYTTAATLAYVGNPEDCSIMLLTSIELWVALDKSAIHHYPLLQEYDPGFPRTVFEPLLLSKKSQMERLFRVEHYLTGRRTKALHDHSSIFHSIGSKDSFAVRYFEQSQRHQDLRRRIEATANQKRSQKLAELRDKQQQYQRLMDQSQQLDCQNVERWSHRRRITVHKTWKRNLWCLTLTCLALAKWRDTTYSILVDVLSATSRRDGGRSNGTLYFLRNYEGLKPFVKSPVGKLQLASTVKPFIVSHYRSQLVSQATEGGICVNNGLRYASYDSSKMRLAKELLGSCDVRGSCTLQLPSGPYKLLQYAVSNTVHTSNDVISQQGDCPGILTLDEFYVFGCLRSGYRLQWHNIARELVTRVLDWKREEIHSLVFQASREAGPLDDDGVCRGSHAVLQEEDFGKSVLSGLNDALGSIENNWQGSIAMRTFVVIGTRLLSLSPHHAVHEGCIRFLRRARDVTLRWSRILSPKLQDCKDDERKDLNERALEMALTCYATFDVDLTYLPNLMNSAEDVAVVTEC